MSESAEKVIAYMLIRVNLGKEYDVLEQITRLPNIKEARVVYGEYDIVVEIHTNNLRELDKIVTLIRKLPGVITSTTLISS